MKDKLIMKYPASWHGDMGREGVPVGNGKIGGLVYGGVYKEIISIVDGKLWTKGKTPDMPDVRYILPKMRKLLDENKPIEAENLYRDEFKKLGYEPIGGNQLPLCDIEIIQSNRDGFKNYRRVLDMQSAEAQVVWNDNNTEYERRFFISRADDSAYLSMTSKNGTTDAEFNIKIHDEETLGEEPAPQNRETIVKDNMIFFAASKDGSDFGAVARLEHNGNIVSKNNKICITGATRIEMRVKFFIFGERERDWRVCEKCLTDVDYDAAFLKHKQMHYGVYSRMNLELTKDDLKRSNEELLLDAYSGTASIELIEKLWKFGRYLLICASSKDGYPCHMHGLWISGYDVWWAYNMFNVNIEMIYWQALSGGMPELALAVFEYLDDKMEDFRTNAKNMYGCRGINIPSVSTPETGLHKCLLPHILHWTGAAAWISQLWYDYYLYTGDKKFLKDRAMPFMYEAAHFYEDFLYEGDDGKYIFSPSNSPENTPKNIKDVVGRDCEVTVNATMDVALLKELLTNLIKGAKITGKYADKTECWTKMLEKLPDYQINEDGAIKEWIHPFYTDNYEHRHQSHIYPVFPGYEIIRGESDLYKAFERAIEMRETVGLKDQSGWSLAYMANVYSRMGRGDDALNCLDYLTRSVVLPNFLTVHNDWRRMGVAICDDLRSAPIQLDAIMGLSAAINEMLVFSTENRIYLFNAMPKRFAQGAVDGICTRAGYKVSLKWKDEKACAILECICCDREITAILPENMRFEINDSKSVVLKPTENRTEYQIKVLQ